MNSSCLRQLCVCCICVKGTKHVHRNCPFVSLILFVSKIKMLKRFVWSYFMCNKCMMALFIFFWFICLFPLTVMLPSLLLSNCKAFTFDFFHPLQLHSLCMSLGASQLLPFLLPDVLLCLYIFLVRWLSFILRADFARMNLFWFVVMWTGKEDGKSCQKVTVRMTIRKNDCRSNRPVCCAITVSVNLVFLGLHFPNNVPIYYWGVLL